MSFQGQVQVSQGENMSEQGQSHISRKSFLVTPISKDL